MNTSLVEARKIVMEKCLVALHQFLPESELLIANHEAYVFEHHAGGLVLGLKAWLLDGHKLDKMPERSSIEFPETPWQFFKQEYAPKWFLKKFPVKNSVREITTAIHHHYLCPHVNVPKKEVHFVWMGEMSGQIPTREN